MDPWLDWYSLRGFMIGCDRIHSFLTAVHCFNDGYAGQSNEKNIVKRTSKKNLEENMDRCTSGSNDERGVKHKTINQSLPHEEQNEERLVVVTHERRHYNFLF